MSYPYKMKTLAFGELPSTKGDVYIPTGKTRLIYTILLHNTNTSTESVELYFNNGTIEKRLFKFDLEENESQILSFEPWGLAVENWSKITGKSTTSSKVVYKIDGSVDSSSNILYVPTEKSISFSGAIRYINCGNDICKFERTDSFSISLWFKIGTSDTDQRFVSKVSRTTSLAGFNFGCSSDKLQFNLQNNSTTNRLQIRGGTTITDSIWRHGVVTYDGSSVSTGVKLYLNSSLQSNTVVLNTLSSSTINYENLYIGADGTTEQYGVNGNLCELGIYNRVLTSGEIISIYNSGVPLDIRKLDSSTAFIEHWRLGTEDTVPTSNGIINENNGTMTNIDFSNISISIPEV